MKNYQINYSARLYYPVSKESVEGMAMTRYMSRNVAKGLAKKECIEKNEF